MAELTGRAKVEHGTVQAPVEHDRRVAQRAIGDRDGHAADHVVGDLVPRQDPQGIGAAFAGNGQADDRLGVGKIVDLCHRAEARIVDGRDAILGRPAIPDLAEIDQGALEVGHGPLAHPARRLCVGGRGRGAERQEEKGPNSAH